jgi:hypothetical protein
VYLAHPYDKFVPLIEDIDCLAVPRRCQQMSNSGSDRLTFGGRKAQLRVTLHGSNGSISMTIAVMSMEQGSIVTSPMEKSAD